MHLSSVVTCILLLHWNIVYAERASRPQFPVTDLNPPIIDFDLTIFGEAREIKIPDVGRKLRKPKKDSKPKSDASTAGQKLSDKKVKKVQAPVPIKLQRTKELAQFRYNPRKAGL